MASNISNFSPARATRNASPPRSVTTRFVDVPQVKTQVTGARKTIPRIARYQPVKTR